jgi:50S ribosomal protein L16 3-hydroxylase
VQGLRQLVEGGLEREMELTWLRFVSGGGFLQGPLPASHVTLDEARSVRLVSEAGLVWRKLASGELAFAVNGHATALPESRGLPQVLQRLSGGGAHRVRALLDEATEERRGETVVWSRERMRELLTTLLSQHALVYS